MCGLELAALLAHGASRAAAVHDKVVAWFGLRCGAAVPGTAHMLCRAGGRQREGSHAQMPRTFRLSLLRIEVRLREVMHQMAQ